MKTPLGTLLLLASTAITLAADAADKKAADDTIFREPFTLKLHIDKESFYEERFGKMPFVHHGDVCLFKGDEFGLGLDIQAGSVRAVTYQPDLKKADVTLKFTQEVKADGGAMMMLHIRNTTTHTLHLDALMTVPGRKDIARTSMLPVQAGLSSYESWPHPIVQLVLQNLRIKK